MSDNNQTNPPKVCKACRFLALDLVHCMSICTWYGKSFYKCPEVSKQEIEEAGGFEATLNEIERKILNGNS